MLTYSTGAFPQRMRLTQPKDCGSLCIRKSGSTVADAPIFEEAMTYRNRLLYPKKETSATAADGAVEDFFFSQSTT